jgi:hypothetical protein
MSIVTVKRKVRRRQPQNTPTGRRSIRELARGYFAREKSLEFVIELLFFVIIVAVAAWPIFIAVNVLGEFLRQTVS